MLTGRPSPRTARLIASAMNVGVLLLIAITAAHLPAQEAAQEAAAPMSVEQAWQQLPQYEYGKDMAGLLIIDQVVIDAMKTSESRAGCAARLAALLDASLATPAARQYICLQLRQVGTDAQVPVLARLLADPATSCMACMALESIPGEAAGNALREAVDRTTGPALVAVLNSLGKRGESASVDLLARMATDRDREVQAAAWRALGNSDDASAAGLLLDLVTHAPDPLPPQLVASLLQCRDVLLAAGQHDAMKRVYERLAQEGQSPVLRRAGLEGLLTLEGALAFDTMRGWLLEGDETQRRVALGHLSSLSTDQLTSLRADMSSLPTSAVVAVVELLAQRSKTDILEHVLQMAGSEDAQLKLAGVRLLGAIGDRRAVEALVGALAAEGAVADAARQSLQQLSRDDVGPVLIQKLGDPAVRRSAMEVLKNLRYYEAIDPLIELAAEHDPETYALAMDGLRGIADPDDADLPRLLRLLLRVPLGAQRDEAEKTVMIVCGKQTQRAAALERLHAAMDGFDSADALACLPLLGRLGDKSSLPTIEKFVTSGSAAEQELAVRTLCNWPDASVADELLGVAKNAADPSHRRRALRAYVRVITLPGSRSESETLAALQDAMQQAKAVEDQRLILERAGTVRTMPCVLWIAPYLEQPDLAQTACQSLVELAHHRELRHPNMEQFGPLLDKVTQTSRDPEVIERAKRYRLGL